MDDLLKFDENELLKSHLLSSLVAQLNKDLNIQILETELTKSAPFLSLIKVLTPHVVSICSIPGKLDLALNRADITERTMNKFLKHTNNEERAEKLAEIFIKRCFQKVVIREYYK